MSIHFAIAVAVGPDSQELDRTADLIDSVRAYESGACDFVMVDDGPADRNLAGYFSFPENWKPISVPHPRRNSGKQSAIARKGKGICSAVLQAVATIAREAPEARFTLKLDTDSLVIAPFAEKLSALIESHPNAGMIGAYDRTPSGTVRDISKNAETVRALRYPVSIKRKLRNLFGGDELAIISRHIGVAVRNGYQFGEHCLGGGYALSRELLSRMLANHYLDDLSLWLPVDCPEDVMMGMYTKACAMDFVSYVGPNEVFGVRHKGLDDTPERLIERGYSVIHAVKNDPNISEKEIRDFYRAHRTK